MRLRALTGRPLADGKVRSMVLATASAIAERTGVDVSSIEADDSSVTVTLNASRLVGLGFLAELRRLTNAWFEGKHHAGPLWVTRDEQGEEWTPPRDWEPGQE